MVQATSMSYLKRFYLGNTVMDHHPKNVMCVLSPGFSARHKKALMSRVDVSHRLTCVFLATKTENFPISIDTFSSRVKTPPTDILSLEFLVSQSLKFEYKVHHAHLALNGILLDLQVPLSLLSISNLPLTHTRLYRLSPRSTPRQLPLLLQKPNPTCAPLVTHPSNSSTRPPKLPYPAYPFPHLP